MQSIDCYAHFAGKPYFNMAFDDWIAQRVMAINGAVLLRLYTWKQPTITFGFHQSTERAFDRSQLGGIPAIRRITGGRALLHDPSELTYAIGMNLAGQPDRKFETLSSASEFISGMLVEFLGSLGRESQYVRVSSAQNSHPEIFHSAPCFASSARYEVVSAGQKLIASAQRRFTNALFQHGSIKIGGITGHPALGGVGDRDRIEPVTAEQFTEFSAKFFQLIAAQLGMRMRANSDTEQMDNWVAERQKKIAEDSFVQRDTVKQEELKMSL
jgi:lipoate-protein ligase A